MLFDLRGQRGQRSGDTAGTNLLDGGNTEKNPSKGLQPPDRTTRLHPAELLLTTVDCWLAVVHMKLSDACVET